MHIILSTLSSALYWIEVIVAFGILVTVHEFGHFLLAKASGMRVDEFSIGFGKAIFTRKKGETLYAVRAIPLGGYNRIFGMEVEEETSAIEENLPEEEMKRAFNRQPLYKRIAVVLAGSLMNLVLAVIIIFAIRMAWGIDMYQVISVNPGGPADKAGIQEGDVVWAVQGERVGSINVMMLVQQASATPGGIKLTIERQGNLIPITLNAVGVRDTEQGYSDLGFVFFNNGIVSRVYESSTAEKLGLKRDDYIEMENGKPREHYVKVDGEYYLAMKIKRYGKNFTLALPRELVIRDIKRSYTGLGFSYNSDWVVEGINNRSVLDGALTQADKEKVKPGDIILAVNGTPMSDFMFGKDDPFAIEPGETLRVEYSRPDGNNGVWSFEADDPVRMLGIGFLPKIKNVAYDVLQDGLAYTSGLRDGDKIVAIGSEPVKSGLDILLTLAFIHDISNPEAQFKLLYDPLGEAEIPREEWVIGGFENVIPAGLIDESITDEGPAEEEYPSGYKPYFSHVEPTVNLLVNRADGNHRVLLDMSKQDHDANVMANLGFAFASDSRPVGFFEAWKSGFVEMGYWVSHIVYVLKLLVSGSVPMKELMGPVGIITLTYVSAENGLNSLMQLLVLLTVNLAVFNLLPLPALDGGRIVFLLLEAVVRRPVVSVKAENIIHIAGFLALMLFILYITFFDVMRLFTGWL